MSNRHTFTSESVTEGHPDKMADQISDSVLDAVLGEDPYGRVACETMVTTGLVVVAGEISTKAYVDISRLAREAITAIGYTDAAFGIDGRTCGVIVSLDEQSPDIAMGVDKSQEQKTGAGDTYDEVGAGDQGMMFGYACAETEDLMPIPIWLAHKMAQRLAQVRKEGIVDILRPDGKTQVSVEYENGVPTRLNTVLISTQHHPGVNIYDELRPALIEHVIRPSLPEQFADDDFDIFVNPTGQFELGAARRLWPHGSEDHRRHLRRYGPPRWRRVLGQGPDQGRPFGGVRGAADREGGRRVGAGVAVRSAGRVRDRCGAPGVDHGRHVRHRSDRRREARDARA